VSNPDIKAVGFTGSRNGGLALMKIAAARAEPIPVHAEMSSINPVILFPAALAARYAAIAKGFVGSLTMGAGQFCTNPGLLIAVDSPHLDDFLQAVTAKLSAIPAATMLTPGILKAYQHATGAMAGNENITQAAHGKAGTAPNQGEAGFFTTDATHFLADADMRNEMFGAAALLVRCQNQEEAAQVINALEGQLTCTLQIDDADLPASRLLLPVLERKAGRLLANGWPTGVEVSHAMVHGGPYPATSGSRTTAVGTLSIRRFLRPVCYQNMPAALLPEALRDENGMAIPRLIDGELKLG
jgi:alpha-ketoglutaric semialdehyde dehydrogenase